MSAFSHGRSEIFRIFALIAVTIACLAWGAEARAQEMRLENSSHGKVLTNTGEDIFRHSLQRSSQGVRINNGFPTARPAAQTRKSTDKAASASKSSAPNTSGTYAAEHPEGETKANFVIPVRPDGTWDLPAPTVRNVVKKWAFATYDPAKRRSRMVEYYAKDPSGARSLVSVDLNEIILRHARTYNVDPLLIEILIRYESNFDPSATSPVGAGGLMQLMPETAVGLGVYDVYNPDQNVMGGTRYIAGQLRRFNNKVPLALAAYNAGPGAVIEYGGVPPYSETIYYVNAIYGDYLKAKAQRDRRK